MALAVVQTDQPDTASDLLAEYLKSLRRRNCSQETILNYRVCLRVWFRWLDENAVNDPGPEDVETFLDSRHGRAADRSWTAGEGPPFSPRSRHHYQKTINGFYQWAVKFRHVAVNPAESLVAPLLPDNLPRPISEDDLERALDGAPDDLVVMMQLAARAGLRCKEIAAVHSRDLHLERTPPVLVVADPKGRRQRAVPLHPKITEALDRLGIPEDGYLFPGFFFARAENREMRRGRRDEDGSVHVQAGTVSHKGARYLRSCGIDATMHQLRHRAGTIFYQTSKDLRLTQEFLGHRSVVTTQGYTRIDLDDAAQWVDRI